MCRPETNIYLYMYILYVYPYMYCIARQVYIHLQPNLNIFLHKIWCWFVSFRLLSAYEIYFNQNLYEIVIFRKVISGSLSPMIAAAGQHFSPQQKTTNVDCDEFFFNDPARSFYIELKWHHLTCESYLYTN